MKVNFLRSVDNEMECFLTTDLEMIPVLRKEKEVSDGVWRSDYYSNQVTINGKNYKIYYVDHKIDINTKGDTPVVKETVDLYVQRVEKNEETY